MKKALIRNETKPTSRPAWVLTQYNPVNPIQTGILFFTFWTGGGRRGGGLEAPLNYFETAYATAIKFTQDTKPNFHILMQE